jgi:urease accessory protein
MQVSRSVLSVSQVAGRSVVSGAHSQTPLRLLAPKNHGTAAWVFQSSHGGGFVGRDSVSLAVDVQAGAVLFLSSQASSKVYRGADARFELDATVGEDATLVCWPDPVACFAEASLEQRQRFHLAPGASLVCVDAVTSGRAAHGDEWDARRLALSLEVDVAGVPCFRDALLVSKAHGPLRPRLRGLGALATAALLGPRFAGVASQLSAQALAARPLVVCSPHPNGAVLRFAAPSAEALAHAVRALLSPLVTPLLGEDPFERKW